MTDPTNYQQYLKLADTLIKMASKEDIAECARVLALSVAHYEMKFGELPLDEVLAETYTGTPNERQSEMVAKGMETLVGVLGSVVQGFSIKVNH